MVQLLMDKRFAAIFVLVLLLSLTARFYDLEKDGFRMDLYGTSPGDEGGYLQNVRNKALFGDWKLEDQLFNPMYFSLTLTFFEYISFKALGVSIFAARIVPAILGLISIMFVSFLLFLKNRNEGVIYFILLIINTFLIAYSRIGTSESVIVFFLLIILGLIIYNKNYAWILAGFFVPFLFFSKSTTTFFILTIPTSLVLYYFLYKERIMIRKLFYFTIGSIISGSLWLLWLIPRIDDWILMNLGFGDRLLFTITKPLGALFNTFQFSIKNPFILILALTSIFLTIRSLVKKEKIQFIDFFLVVSLIMFYLQISVLDMHLRRFVMIMPILLLIAARFINKIRQFNINIGSKPFKIDKTTVVLLIILVYAFINIINLGTFFNDSYVDYDRAHTYLKVSREINDYIPPGSTVFGSQAVAYSLENKIRPYFDPHELQFIDYETYTLSLLEDKIQYAVLLDNLFDEDDLKRRLARAKPKQKKIYEYIKNNFEIIATLTSKNTHTNFGDQKVYIYKKIELEQPK